MSLPDAQPREAQRTTPRMWFSVLTVSVGIFSMITAEQLPVGLIPAIADQLGVSVGTAGLTVTVPGVIAAFASVGLPLAVGRLDRRVLLAALLVVMAVASTISALAPSFAVQLVSRLLVGITIGGFWAIAGSLAVRLVPGPAVPRALVLIFGGVGAAAVLGVPIGTMIGAAVGWRGAFWSLAGLSVAVLIAALALLPPLPATEPVHLAALRAQLRNPVLVAGIAATALLVAGHYGAYTFVSPALQDISGVRSTIIGPLLLGYGVLGMVGNAVAGSWAARGAGRTMAAIVLVLGAALALFPLLGASPWTGAALLLVWGLAYGAAPVTLQTWVLGAAPQSAEAATAIYCFVFNLAIALGALASSVVVDDMGVNTVLWAAAVLVLLVLLTVRRAPAATQSQ
ncbi:MFS transporter [Labedaea rhizosphaerae]|uniref:Putative MFS family arabinose efflux permease n=1 Tax=Labedaea rhizosphaerae TaxID=598644 RepID=A0A4R6SCS2_LABRH|nr:MFS transporter [Labedaea rhizosphaerae]TDP96785.1 putative MFS family arabinose efflux permease [Labedaea rhizosphaerae]